MRIARRGAIVAVLLACATIPIGGQASSWIEVGAATNGVKVFVDAASFVSERGGVRLNQRFVFPASEPHILGRVEQQVVYGCTSRTVRTLKSVEFSRRGGVVRADTGEVAPPYRISPGSLPQYVFDLVC